MHRLIPAVFVAALLAACTETSTEPQAITAPAEHPSLSAGLPGTSVTLNAISCNLVSSSTGEVRCSWDISNPDHTLINIWPEARMLIDYECVNPSTGKIRSSGTSSRWAYVYQPNVTDANPSGTNVQLSMVVPPNTNTGRYSKQNVCKGNQTMVIKNYAMPYYELWVDGESASVCLGSDDSYGCETTLID